MFGLVQTGLLQRKCACGQHTIGGECDACRKKRSTLQRHPAAQTEPTTVPPIATRLSISTLNR